MTEVKNQEEVFKDFSKNGKDRQWRERKLKNIELANRLELLGYRSFERVYRCAEVLKFLEREDGTRKLYQAYFCKNKLCALCNWRRSMKYSYQAELVVNEAIRRELKGRFLFLTLTIKNVKGEELNQTITEMGRGFNRLMKYKKVDKNMIGYLRATEVTYSKSRDDYHPHLHVLLFVKSSYFVGNDKNYIKQSDWVGLWQKAMKLDYEPRVDIRTVKLKVEHAESLQEKDGLKKAILETAKYPVKPFDITKDKDGNVMKLSEVKKLQITDDIMNGLHRKRQIGFGKLFKEIKKELELDDLENGNLIQTGEEKTETTAGKEIVAVWNWERSNYFIK